MGLDQMDYDLFVDIKDALFSIAAELHEMNESRNKNSENASLT